MVEREFFIRVIQTCDRCCQSKGEEELDGFITVMTGATARGQQWRCFMVATSLHSMSLASIPVTTHKVTSAPWTNVSSITLT